MVCIRHSLVRRDASLKLKRLPLWTLTVIAILSYTHFEFHSDSAAQLYKVCNVVLIIFLIFGRGDHLKTGASSKNISTTIYCTYQNFPNGKKRQKEES